MTPDFVYLDSQTISPGASFTYEVHYGGSGNRNLTPGDSIFHCHLYPHFAQGMWELWRTHDVFEDGSVTIAGCPMAEVAGGTPIPLLSPCLTRRCRRCRHGGFEGYPFYVAGMLATVRRSRHSTWTPMPTPRTTSRHADAPCGAGGRARDRNGALRDG